MNLLHKINLLIPILLIISAGISNSIYSQPWPDENFCVVSARLIYNDSVSIVGGNGPLDFIWDDGSAENYFAWIIPNGMVAVKYQPPGYPVHVMGGEIYVGDGSYPEGADFIGTDMQILVFDDDGTNSLPGTILDSINITVENYEWVKFGGLDAVIEDGEFYIGMEQLNTPPLAAPVGIDEENPVLFKSYTKAAAGDWQFSSYQDFMIRALTCYIEPEIRIPIPENYFWYELSRVSGFDPENEEGPEDGMLTIIDSLSYFYYQDTLFYTLPPGYYAYAVRIIEENVDTTGWYFTNTLHHQILGAHEKEYEETVVYPNPAINEVRIKSNEMILLVDIVNSYGQTVFIQSFNNKEVLLQTSDLKSGFYFVRIKTNQGITIKKILKT